MSKSRGNVDQPGRLRRARRRRHFRALPAVHRALDQDNDFSDEGVAGVTASWPRVAPGVERRRRERPQPLLGPLEPRRRRPALMRKAHWAIDKVTTTWPAASASTPRSPRSWSWSTRPTAAARRRATRRRLHFATATAASLIFPFAPHTARRSTSALTGERVWETPWPEADLSLLERDVVEIVVQVNGKVRDRVRPRRRHARGARGDGRERPNVSRTYGRQAGRKVIVVPRSSSTSSFAEEPAPVLATEDRCRKLGHKPARRHGHVGQRVPGRISGCATASAMARTATSLTAFRLGSASCPIAIPAGWPPGRCAPSCCCCLRGTSRVRGPRRTPRRHPRDDRGRSARRAARRPRDRRRRRRGQAPGRLPPVDQRPRRGRAASAQAARPAAPT